uniref:Uncharacterized protein n=1 Tax=Anguilla anguilla TaxID=7936 RepID=A0A0E9UGJ0_ANGAN
MQKCKSVSIKKMKGLTETNCEKSS